MLVLQVQQAMAAQAQTKQKAAEAAIQAKIDAEVEKRTKDLPGQTPSLPALTKSQPMKTEDVAPDDGVLQASGRSKGAERWKKHAERADEVEALAERLAVKRRLASPPSFIGMGMRPGAG